MDWLPRVIFGLFAVLILELALIGAICLYKFGVEDKDDYFKRKWVYCPTEMEQDLTETILLQDVLTLKEFLEETVVVEDRVLDEETVEVQKKVEIDNNIQG